MRNGILTLHHANVGVSCTHHVQVIVSRHVLSSIFIASVQNVIHELLTLLLPYLCA
jgi:hypothetical protein